MAMAICAYKMLSTLNLAVMPHPRQGAGDHWQRGTSRMKSKRARPHFFLRHTSNNINLIQGNRAQPSTTAMKLPSPLLALFSAIASTLANQQTPLYSNNAQSDLIDTYAALIPPFATLDPFIPHPSCTVLIPPLVSNKQASSPKS